MAEKYQEKSKQPIDGQNEGTTINEKQYVEVNDIFEKLRQKRIELLTAEQKFVDRITTDKVAIEEIEKFNAKAKEELASKEQNYSPVDFEDIESLRRCLYFADKPIDELKRRYHEKERRYKEIRSEIFEPREKIYKLHRQWSNFLFKISKLEKEKDEQIKKFGEIHERLLEEDVQKQILAHQQKMLKFEAYQKP